MGAAELERPGRVHLSLDLRRLVAGFAALSAGYVLGKGVGFIAVAALARFMPAEQLGLYATTITYVGYLQALTNWGSDALGIRAVAQHPSAAASLSGSVVASRLAVGFVPLLALVVGLALHHASVSGILAVSTAWLAFVFRSDWLLLGRGEARAVGIWVLLREVSFAALAVSVIRSVGTVESGLWCYASAEWIWSLGTRWAARQASASSVERAILSVKDLLVQGVPLAVVSLTVLTSNKIDVPILAHYRSGAEVAAYWTAYNFMFAAMLLSAMWDRVALAAMSRQVADGTARDHGSSLHCSILGGVGGTVIALALHGFAKPLLHTAYRGKFDGASDALSMLALALPAIYLSGILAGRLVAESRQRTWAVAAGIGAVTNLALNLALIPKYGMQGAALATLTSEWTVFAAMVTSFRSAIAFRAFIANVAYLVLGILVSVALVIRFGGPGAPWATIGAVLGFSFYAIPIVMQRLPASLRLRPPLRGFPT